MSVVLQPGDKAPDFTLPSDEGGDIRLKDLAGKPVVLYFYPKDDTSGCTSEAKGFTAAQGEFDALGAVVVRVSKDSARSHGKFRQKHGLSVRLGADEEGTWSSAMASGSRRACTAANTWASSGRRS